MFDSANARIEMRLRAVDAHTVHVGALALEVARLVGVFIFWGAAWYRSVFYCSVGLLVIAFTWVRGALQGSGRIAAEP